MSDKVIPPWEAGSTVVEDAVPRSQYDHISSVARNGGLATQRNKRLRAQGFVVKSAMQLRDEKALQPKEPGVRGNPNPNSVTSVRISRMTDDNLSDKMRDRAIKFCHEYIRDFNVINAWIRIGGNPDTPTPAREMFRWPFVQQYLARMAEEMEAADLIKPGEVVLGLKREANFMGDDSSHSARVSALGKLSRILQMDVKVTKTDVTHRGGVMLIPAANPTMDQWESQTVEGQAKLKTDVTK